MAYSVFILFGTVSILSVASSFSEYAPPPTIVNTTSGPVRGEAIVLNTNKTLVQYLGIPFAKAGRFEAPQSPTPWKDTKNTTSFGQACPQNPSPIVNSTEKDTAEDCLNLNVFIPRDKETEKGLKLSVMVWIYGGGFSVGSAAYHVYNGQYLATEGQVIVVTFNYRLGVLGFLSTGSEEIPGNFGLLDQVKALQWVQQNIERFGGNPKNVTIFGHSAGAASVALHMLSPLSYGLYHKVIIQSGSAAATFGANEKKTAKELASKPAPDDKWPVYTLEEEQYISLSPASSIQAKMLPEKMAFWNLLVPSLTEPQPTLVPFIPTSPVTSRPPGQAAAVADKETEYALIGVVVVLAVLLLVLLVVVWRYRRKLGDAISEPGPTTRLI